MKAKTKYGIGTVLSGTNRNVKTLVVKIKNTVYRLPITECEFIRRPGGIALHVYNKR